MHIYLYSYIHISAIRACLGNSGVGGVRWRGVKGVGAPSSRQFHKVCCSVLQRELQRELQCGFVLVHKAALYCSVLPCVAVCLSCIDISYVCTFKHTPSIPPLLGFLVPGVLRVFWDLLFYLSSCSAILSGDVIPLKKRKIHEDIVFLFCHPFGTFCFIFFPFLLSFWGT